MKFIALRSAVVATAIICGAIAPVACTATQEHAAIPCTVADRAKIAEILKRKLDPEATLEALALEVGPDVVACTLAAKQAEAKAANGSGSGASR